MAITEGLAYLLMATALTAVLLSKTGTRAERVAAVIMIGTLVVGGLDSVLDGFPSALVVPAMVIGLCGSLLALAYDRLGRSADPSDA